MTKMSQIIVIANMAPALQMIIDHINQMAANKHQTARDGKETTKPSKSSAERWVRAGCRTGAQARPCRTVGSPC